MGVRQARASRESTMRVMTPGGGVLPNAQRHVLTTLATNAAKGFSQKWGVAALAQNPFIRNPSPGGATTYRQGINVITSSL